MSVGVLVMSAVCQELCGSRDVADCCLYISERRKDIVGLGLMVCGLYCTQYYESEFDRNIEKTSYLALYIYHDGEGDNTGFMKAMDNSAEH